MKRTLIIAAALAGLAAPLSASAQSAPSEPSVSRFIRDGVTYSYTTERRDGRRVLIGSADGRRFHLTVRKHKVSGVYDGKLVYFYLRERRPDVARDRFAAR